MSKQKKAIVRFKEDIEQHIEVIDGLLDEGNVQEAMSWISELVLMRKGFQVEARKPAGSITLTNMADGKVVEHSMHKDDIRRATECARHIENELRKIGNKLKKKGYNLTY